MSRLFYNLKQSFVQMGRNKGMYFTTIMAITAMMLILGIFFVALVNVNIFTRSIEKDYNVMQVYVKADTKQQDAEALGAELQEMYPGCDVEVMYGGQPLYYYLLSVE